MKTSLPLGGFETPPLVDISQWVSRLTNPVPSESH